ncbi:MAG: hypothetical protein L6Q37_00915 [Bdellovibrionaceae bacterium]|nr:hypothetical protein [Pseudobdellovibrionaceae bacterium]NUM58569.1 hypothetical protein [Pseudobdellovibrionaceae bacterium]
MRVKLVPFEEVTSESYKDFTVEAELKLIEGELNITYLVTDKKHLSELLSVQRDSPKGSLKPSDFQVLDASYRRDEIWKGNCFEFFVKQDNSEAYFEFNGSLNGEWNFYKLPFYRGNLQRENLISQVLFKSIQSEEQIKVEYLIDLKKIFSDFKNLKFNICSVLLIQQKMSYWAVNHNPIKPDFHYQQAMKIRI